MGGYSRWALLLSIIGFTFIFVPFTSTFGWLQNENVFVLGILTFITSLVVAIIALVRKEKGLVKIIPFLFLLLLLIFVLNFASIMGGV